MAADIHIFKTRPDEQGLQHYRARISISQSAGNYEPPPQKILYTRKWFERSSLWEDIDAKLTLENIR